MTSISNNVNIDKLDNIVDKNNNNHRTMKMAPFDNKPSIYIDFDVEKNDEDSKRKVGDHVRISKHNSFAKGYTPK